ncbi:MAG TPA: response regulator, partial [Bradyrhizobium sp.]|nr:response regulator [Bradyrhizobium sp.]
GFAVVTARGGLDGLRLVRELRPAAVTLDIMMPDLDGWTVLAAIKGDPALASIPVVLMSCHSLIVWVLRLIPSSAPSHSN